MAALPASVADATHWHTDQGDDREVPAYRPAIATGLPGLRTKVDDFVGREAGGSGDTQLISYQ
jgi:hypothetical protein